MCILQEGGATQGDTMNSERLSRRPAWEDADIGLFVRLGSREETAAVPWCGGYTFACVLPADYSP